MSKIKFQTIAISKRVTTKKGKPALVYEFDTNALNHITEEDFSKVWCFDFNSDTPSLVGLVSPKNQVITKERLLELREEVKKNISFSSHGNMASMSAQQSGKMILIDELLGELGYIEKQEESSPF